MEAILYFTKGTCLYIWKLTFRDLPEAPLHNPELRHLQTLSVVIMEFMP
jgi:hypothetical protein